MLLAVDIGNTHTVLGVFSGERLEAHWRVSTHQDHTADELRALLRALFGEAGLAPERIEGVIVSSVVPDMDRTVEELARAAFAREPLFVGPGIRTGMPILYENPREVGADRIVNAVAAHARYGAPVIVLDFGTATTFDVVSPRGEYLGGIIAPGLGVSAEALFRRAARLVRVEARKPPRAIGRNTADSLRSGLYFGYAALVTGLVERIRSELGNPAPVIATGGWAGVLADELPFLAAVEPTLTLEGLRLVWERNRP